MVWTRQSIRVRPSRALAAYLILIHGVAAVGIVASPLSVSLAFASYLLLGASLVLGLRRVLLLSPGAVVGLTCDRNGGWSLALADGRVFVAKLKPGALIHPRLMVLNFRGPRRGFNVVLIDDNADQDEVRRLRVRLRLGR
ncbi:MAG: hypothetical protein GC138_01615 [Gammaproteobacteria bacterium]|nr:hypothetical protein [Gammaproteobacteria bacterium]